MTPFLRLPPFPGHRAPPLAGQGNKTPLDPEQGQELSDLLRAHRVGGSFWASQPGLPDGRHIVIAPSSVGQCLEMLEQARAIEVIGRCVLLAQGAGEAGVAKGEVPVIKGPVDPWHLAEAATEVWAAADEELLLVAALAGTPTRQFGCGRFVGCNEGDEQLASAVLDALGQGLSYRCPYSGKSSSARDTILLLADLRRLIDGNRQISGVAGVAGWKRPTVDPLLWDGCHPPRHIRRVPNPAGSASMLVVWKSRTSPSLLRDLEEASFRLAEIEDGMIRGPGLGANCVPPLSVVVDRLGIYFDPSAPSELEQILETADIAPELVDRASRLRRRIVETGISKYGRASNEHPKIKTSQRHILVVGQVEDDRSVLSGGAGQTNLELLVRTRQLEPAAWITYRPHPDVDAGHRKGHLSDELVLCHANEIDRQSPIARLIDVADEMHCITSLAGFEALMRGKPVTAHGMPFYGGWGLTTDLAPIPARRTRRRSIDELVAATLILYPRYFDPVTRLPCPPEVLVERIASGEAGVAAPLEGIRKLQGKLKLALRGIQRSAA